VSNVNEQRNERFMMNTGTEQKKAILFGGTDGHGATMTVISEKILQREGYGVRTLCEKLRETGKSSEEIPKYIGTGKPEYFWGSTFLHMDYTELRKGDLIIVVDLPLPLQNELDFSAADKAIDKIKELCDNGIRIILIDHHKRAITHYDRARRAGAEVVFSIGGEQFCHYGDPDCFSLFWGSIGAICDRDPSMLPVEEQEKSLFEELEGYAAWVDREKYTLPQLLWRMRRDDRDFPKFEKAESAVFQKDGKVSFLERLEKDGGFKQLDAACEKNNTPYGVGIVHDGSAILVINYWKPTGNETTIPVAVRLHQYRRNIVGHDSAIVIRMEKPDRETAIQKMREIIKILNSDSIQSGERSSEQLSSNADAVEYVARVFKEIPIAYYLTAHGWIHVETVIANARLLGSISNLTKDEQELLNWAALFHDIGNGAMNYDVGAKSKVEARKDHHLYTVKILKQWKMDGLFRGLISDKEFETICELCEKHRKKSDLPKDPRTAQLCALLRIADALDKTKSRARMNDEGIPASEVMEECIRKGETDPIPHWEGQLAIESIRLHLVGDHITFEFLVTNREKADFIIKDFEEELVPLQAIIPQREIKVTDVPECGGDTP